ncbi:phenylacetate--CoA ligase family protein [Bartonella doshiae]|uniref:Phenylacetate-coenzyme A ligase n=2 Tax=Bartonella doshiae TaxID=33044 RepID=A0A380ZFL0_BARDO|nr:phenylacetate--CoA ligase family protein [Bartonella doshiae]EJF79640.1 hypothetical protein MCS_01367 [Bartonella doshiae NCTC 12862 = ATCC 700133]MBB6160077.1 phenylacetate-CoA ligase [Bartonella doshiae]SUV45391.1 Phenylacetate-coenzyme A ligase [Bartonella doshiae]
MRESSKVFDVETQCTTNLEVAPYIRRSKRFLRETVEAQKKLYKKWMKEKSTLRKVLRIPPAIRRQIQFQQLVELVDFVYLTKPFYRELYQNAGYEAGCLRTWSDFECLPIVSKEMMVEAEFDKQCMSTIKPEVLHSARTSGSSGLNLTIYQDSDSVYFRHVRYMRHCELLLGRQMKATDLRYGIYFVAERFTSLLGDYKYVTVSQDAPTKVVETHLRELKPALLLSLPSYLQRLASTGLNLESIGIEAIGTNSERSSLEERVNLSKKLGIPVLDEYSSEEMSLIAYECNCRQYHLVEDSGYFELINVGRDGYGKLVGTSFGNRAMPFVRYDQGDLVRFSSSENCTCGSTFRMIQSFRGREDEHLLDGFNNFVPADVILGLCDETLVDYKSNVLAYQIVQVAQDKAILYIKPIDPSKGLDNRCVKEFITRFSSLFHYVKMQISISVTDKLNTFLSGKRQLIRVEDFLKGKVL